ncbi:hypothetical protein LZ32DRAFT_603827 [Colletotrichum eremochloae]|nr:hypothetical protein LZ32DRAFT_603827 [Colletotrichum eremochloae]
MLPSLSLSLHSLFRSHSRCRFRPTLPSLPPLLHCPAAYPATTNLANDDCGSTQLAANGSSTKCPFQPCLSRRMNSLSLAPTTRLGRLFAPRR